MAKNIKISSDDINKMLMLLDRKTLVRIMEKIIMEFPIIRQEFLEIFKSGYVMDKIIDKFEIFKALVRGGVKPETVRIILGITTEEYEQYTTKQRKLSAGKFVELFVDKSGGQKKDGK